MMIGCCDGLDPLYSADSFEQADLGVFRAGHASVLTMASTGS